MGKVSDGKGVESRELSINESKAIAQEAKDGGFDPEKHGISKEAQLAEVRVAYLDQALKAGLTAATITAITQLVPELYKAIDYLIKHGEIDLNQLKKSGGKVISAIGSLLGCSLAVVYNIGKKKLISFCVDTGFTCFGLVEQNYELPDEVLGEIGIDTVKVGRAKVNTTPVARTQTTANIGRVAYETVDITVLKRGVIGVNKIGYVL